MKHTLGLIIGRFQPLHKGHLLLIQKSLSENHRTLILVGSSNKNNTLNPYSYESRKEMIYGEIGKGLVSIEALPDFPNDQDWIKNILNTIDENTKKVRLYCGDKLNDSAVQSIISLEKTLPFDLNIIEISRSIIPISATQVRIWIHQKNIHELEKYVGIKTLEKIL